TITLCAVDKDLTVLQRRSIRGPVGFFDTLDTVHRPERMPVDSSFGLFSVPALAAHPAGWAAGVFVAPGEELSSNGCPMRSDVKFGMAERTAEFDHFL